MCLSETFLDSYIDISDTRINLNNYSLLRADRSNNTKCGGICIYYKDCLLRLGELPYLIFKNV